MFNNKNKNFFLIFIAFIVFFVSNNFILANNDFEVNKDQIIKASVSRVGDVIKNNDEDSDTEFSQKVFITLPKNKKEIEINNTYIPLKSGDNIFVKKEQNIDNDKEVNQYYLLEINRTNVLLFLLFLFLIIIFAFMGKKGIKSIISLLISIFIILFGLVPIILNGGQILFWSIFFVLIILAVVMFTGNGFNRKTTSAFLGTLFSILITSLMSFIFVKIMNFSGLTSESAFNLHMDGLNINFSDLLLSGIIIGIVGILDDIAITQASIVEELKKIGISSKEIYKKSMKIGKDHIDALLNTLFLAYIGAFFPLVLWFYNTSEPLNLLLSKEIIASEIVRVLIGSIGLILAVPLVTIISIFLIKQKR